LNSFFGPMFHHIISIMNDGLRNLSCAIDGETGVSVLPLEIEQFVPV
jgi:hypothetical protein